MSIIWRRANTGGSAAPGEARGKVDYREVLSPEQFAAFVKLRALRQAIAKDEAVPVYVIFTNEQLAAMVQKGARRARPTWARSTGSARRESRSTGIASSPVSKEHRDGKHEASRAG